MAEMTDAEADALDELWTRTTPEINTSKPGFLTRNGFTMVSIDPITATYLQAKAAVTHYSLSEIIGELVKKEMSATESA
jgi:N-acetylglutamate synthase-like GNAT family acetyltransferase